MRAVFALAAALLALTGCTTSVLEMRAPPANVELWGSRTLVVADLGNADNYRRDAEEAFASWLPGAVSASALEVREAAFEGENEEDRGTWDTIVNIDVAGGKRAKFDRLDHEAVLDSRDGYFYEYVDFRVSVVRRADGKELLSMVVRSRAGGAGTDSFEQLLEYASKRAGKELLKTGLFK